MSLPFLLEIGAEEIPDWMLVPALNQLQDTFQTLLDQQALGGRVTSVDATPRRLVLKAEGLLDRQADTEELLLGPPKSAGAGAANGFAKKMGTTVDQLGVESTAKGEYFSFKKKTQGQPTAAILSRELPSLILRIQWPKTMYWNGKGTEHFIRPIRWLVVLLGESVVPFEIAGVKSGNTSAGHRLLGKPSFPVTIADFDQQLRANGVILSAEERRQKIAREIQVLADTELLSLQRDDDLVRTLVYMTEFPTAILGSFDAQFLELPQEVLVTVMKHHQRYFSVLGAGGKLAPRFITVMNTDADPEGLVRQGNESVLRSRFSDATFFWRNDRKRKLEERLEDLKQVTFQVKLGSYYDKTLRTMRLVMDLGGDHQAVRAAELAKCDLTTDMVKEFPELQGIMGGRYAKAEDLPESVWLSIYQHYWPVTMEDPIPLKMEGRIVALADKLDTLRECFRVGLMPTGSKDPLALRRAAQGVVRIIVEGKMNFSLNNESPELREFFRDRIEYYFRDVRGFKYDEVRACMAAGWEDLPDLEARLQRVQAIRPTPDFEPLAASFKRIKNILKQANFAGGGNVDPALLEAGPEKDLWDEHCTTKSQPLETRIAAMRPRIDLFFDKVLVNAPDAAIRTNRLTLLNNLLTEFSTIADFSEIVTEKGS